MPRKTTKYVDYHISRRYLWWWNYVRFLFIYGSCARVYFAVSKKKTCVFKISLRSQCLWGVVCVIAQIHRQMVMRKKGSNRKRGAAGQGRAVQEKCVLVCSSDERQNVYTFTSEVRTGL